MTTGTHPWSRTTDVVSPTRAVVVGVDGSGHNRSAVRWAAHEAASSGSPLLLAHAIDDYVYFTDSSLEGSAQALLQRVRRELAGVLDESEVEPYAEPGRALDVLLEQTQRGRILVLGKRGGGGFARLLVGSTSIAAAGRAEVPIVIVPDEWDQPASRDAPVVLGVDVDHSDIEPVRFAFGRARRLGVPLVAVNAWSTYPSVSLLTTDLVSTFDVWERDAERDLRDAVRPWADRFADVDLRLQSRHGHGGLALLDAAADAQLIVVGRHRSGALGGLPLGSVSRAVLHHSECPVVVVPTR